MDVFCPDAYQRNILTVLQGRDQVTPVPAHPLCLVNWRLCAAADIHDRAQAFDSRTLIQYFDFDSSFGRKKAEGFPERRNHISFVYTVLWAGISCDARTVTAH